jgi:hypothetical protein
MRIPMIFAAGLAVAAVAAPALAATPHYDIHARLDIPAQTVGADVTIVLPPEEVGHETVFVLGNWMKVDLADGGPGAKVHVEPTDKPFKGLNKIVFDYANAPSRPVTLHFRYSGLIHTPDDKPLIDPTLGVEMGFEDAWIPVRPNFGLHFTVDADITGVPADEVAVAQGQVRHEGDRLIIHRTFTDIDMPFSALAGLKKSAKPVVEVYARHPDGLLESAYRENAGRIVDYYTKLFGPLPASALPARLVVLPRKGASYERRGYISTGEASPEDLKSLGHIEDWMLTATIAHEFAHGWWSAGDPLTENNWLNESFAEYSSLRFTEATYGEAPLKARLDPKIERAKKAGPVIGTGRPSSTASYQKGPVLLFDLDHKIGRAKMDKLLGILGRNPPRTTEQFLKVLSDVAGPQVAHDFEAALRAP